MKRVGNSESSKPSLIKVKWISGMRFVASDNSGHSIVMDASKQSDGEASGFSPMQLLLVALGGCTGMDVIHIMQKQSQQVNDLEMTISGKRVDEPPRVYSNVHVDYEIKGRDIKENAIQRAIQLSEEKYCSVGATLGARAKITSNYVIR